MQLTGNLYCSTSSKTSGQTVLNQASFPGGRKHPDDLSTGRLAGSKSAHVVSPQRKELNTQQNEQSFQKMGKLWDYCTNIIGTGEFHF